MLPDGVGRRNTQALPRGGQLGPRGPTTRPASHRCRCAVTTAVVEAPPTARAGRPSRAAPIGRARRWGPPRRGDAPPRSVGPRLRPPVDAAVAAGSSSPHVTSENSRTTQIAMNERAAMPDDGASPLDRCPVGFGPRGAAHAQPPPAPRRCAPRPRGPTADARMPQAGAPDGDSVAATTPARPEASAAEARRPPSR